MGRKSLYGRDIVKRWTEKMLSGTTHIKGIAIAADTNTVAYGIVNQLCKSAWLLREQGKRIELRVVDIDPLNDKIGDEIEGALYGSEGKVAHE